jgi:hypothetical protein
MHVYCFATTPPSVHRDGAFDSDMMERSILHVPEEAIAAYKEAFEWKDFQQIVAIDAQSMGVATVTEKAPADSRYYDLMGRSVTRQVLRRGLYINNRKKIIVR